MRPRLPVALLALLALLVLGAGACAQDKGAASRPNIVFILADDLRADSIGASGNRDIHTPNLDRLAREGAYFTRATVHVAQCCPCRAMLVTGLAPHQSGYISIDIQRGRCAEPDGLDDVPTLPRLLRDAGYRTVLVGKWHIHPDPWRCGFADIRHWLAEGAGPYRDPQLCSGPSRATAPASGYTNEIFADDAIAFLSSPEAREKPFFLWLAPTAPHGPLEPTPDRIGELYKGKTSDDLVRPGIPKGASRQWKDLWLPYYRAVSHLDEQVGRVLGALEERGLARNTIVIFTSDSGIMMGRRGIDSKVVPYEDSVRIPLIIRDPPLAAAPPASPAPVSALDLPPTMLAMAGLAAPAPWPGRDLSRLAAGKADPAVREAVCEWVDDTSPAWGKWAFHSIFDGRYKLIVWTARGKKSELYDIDADPYEERDLSGKPGNAPIGADLRVRLGRWIERTAAAPPPSGGK